jgi:hypothetical protein
MDKDKINSKIEDLEAELQKLKQLANEPEQREPEAGDVWENHGGSMYILTNNNTNTLLNTKYAGSTNTYCHSKVAEKGTHLGKFNDVYVKISDVRAALSHKDVDGEDMLDYFNQEFKSKVQNYGAGESFKSLCDLNIITD